MHSRPDHITYEPEYADGVPLTHNEHSLVFDGADGALLAI